VDPFALIMIGVVLALLVWVLILGRWHPRSGADVLDWRPTRSAEVEAQNEIDDVEQMLAATNERRRRRGDPELTEEEMQERVREDRRLADELRDRYMADTDLRQMLDATNERRRRRGEPELSEAEYRAQLDADRARLERS
jgi:hypothetical protein